MTATVDVVVVSYNSRGKVRECVQPLCDIAGVDVVVVDNASADRSLEAVRDLPVRTIQLSLNGGFAHGCNRGWRSGSAPFVLFLNPDASIDEGGIRALVATLERHPGVGAAAPKIVDEDGNLDFSQRRFPRLVSTYAQALFLHRVFPRRAWTDELVSDPGAYERLGTPDWVSGACLLVRRSVLLDLDGFDEGFFMYCEDIDLCLRIKQAGYGLAYVPEAVVIHEGGASAPRASLLPVLTASRLRYARKHRGRVAAIVERLGIALGALTHIVVSRGGNSVRAGHARSLRFALSRPPAQT